MMNVPKLSGHSKIIKYFNNNCIKILGVFESLVRQEAFIYQLVEVQPVN